ncbi:nucleotidyltransferase domain-containing protein [Ferroglobus sp.]|uniref:nucleotidyltransferase domain-containing protein n=1 Tax=Ferroglobus sp. TaxID=2614230 RepID=UPI0025C6851F|nr:nucleotidyltransferase domain-containing protein [Ferroglobus sp.]
MEFLRDVYKRRKKYFEELEKYLEEIKKFVDYICPDAKVYVFGSVVEGDYSVGLSDIDVAVVSNDFEDRNKKLEVFGKLTKKFFESPFEFHVLTEEQWENLRRFAKRYREVG